MNVWLSESTRVHVAHGEITSGEIRAWFSGLLRCNIGSLSEVRFLPMLNKKLKEIAQYKAKIAALEKAILAERQSKLKKLQDDLGFDSSVDLIKALRSLDAGAPKSSGKAKAGAAKKPRRKRALVTAEMREGIAAALREGGKAAAVAKQFDVSVPTVQNVKRAAGLTRGAKGAA